MDRVAHAKRCGIRDKQGPSYWISGEVAIWLRVLLSVRSLLSFARRLKNQVMRNATTIQGRYASHGRKLKAGLTGSPEVVNSVSRFALLPRITWRCTNKFGSTIPLDLSIERVRTSDTNGRHNWQSTAQLFSIARFVLMLLLA